MSAVHPMMESGGNGSVQTAATGTNWAALTAQACKQITIVNDTGTKLEVRQDGGTGLRVLDSSYLTFYGIRNANQLEVRRVDTSNTQVTTTYRWEG